MNINTLFKNSVNLSKKTLTSIVNIYLKLKEKKTKSFFKNNTAFNITQVL